MENVERMSKSQVSEEIKTLSKYFSCVRVLDASSVSAPEMSIASKGSECDCYRVWDRSVPCDYCVSARALADRETKNKIETVGDKVFSVTARYVEIDGKPSVIEMIREFDSDFIAEYSRESSRIPKLDDYYDKIYIDILTGCYNRRFYEERLKNSTIRAGVAFMDIDDFKLFNDVYGHAAGDEILRAVVGQLRSCMRSVDKLIRYGGDEFVAVFPGIERGALLDRLNSIREKILQI